MVSPWGAAPPAILYRAPIAPPLDPVFASLAHPSAAGIAQVLSTPTAATLAWAHFLAFDLLVGRWAYLDSRERNLSVWIVSPALFFIFMVGPVGFLLYLLVRLAATRLSRSA